MAGRKIQAADAHEGNRCNCTTLRKASRRISQLYDMALAPSGLKTTQRAILAQISRSEPTMVGALAEALVMDSRRACTHAETAGAGRSGRCGDRPPTTGATG